MSKYNVALYAEGVSYAPEDLPALLTLAREDAGLTQQQLAQRSGVQQPVISAVERGR
ncbi:MAG: helix-turn-helix domain-containing protein, partial [Sciscionella sp.]